MGHLHVSCFFVSILFSTQPAHKQRIAKETSLHQSSALNFPMSNISTCTLLLIRVIHHDPSEPSRNEMKIYSDSLVATSSLNYWNRFFAVFQTSVNLFGRIPSLSIERAYIRGRRELSQKYKSRVLIFHCCAIVDAEQKKKMPVNNILYIFTESQQNRFASFLLYAVLPLFFIRNNDLSNYFPFYYV